MSEGPFRLHFSQAGSVTCDLKGNINNIDLHSTGLKGVFPVPYQVRDFAFLKKLDICKLIECYTFIVIVPWHCNTFLILLLFLDPKFLVDNALTSIESNIGHMTNLTHVDMGKANGVYFCEHDSILSKCAHIFFYFENYVSR